VFPSSDRRHHEDVCLVGSDADEEAFNSPFYATNDFLYRKLPLSRPIPPNMCDIFHETLAVRFVDASNFKTRAWGLVMTDGHSALNCLKSPLAPVVLLPSNSSSDESVNHFTYRATYRGSAIGTNAKCRQPLKVSAFREILLQKSKMERRQKSRKSRFLDSSTAATLCIADARVRGRFRGKQ
jgi:hypothetical protein